MHCRQHSIAQAHSLDLRQLRQVLAIAESRNYLRAAEALHISQSALSRSIQSLEATLGVTLFDRYKRNVEPTEFGPTGDRTCAVARPCGARSRSRPRAGPRPRDGRASHRRRTLWRCRAGGQARRPTLRQAPEPANDSRDRAVGGLPGRLRSREIDLMVAEVRNVRGKDEFEVTELAPIRPWSRAGRTIRCWASSPRRPRRVPLPARRPARSGRGLRVHPAAAPPQRSRGITSPRLAVGDVRQLAGAQDGDAELRRTLLDERVHGRRRVAHGHARRVAAALRFRPVAPRLASRGCAAALSRKPARAFVELLLAARCGTASARAGAGASRLSER